MITIGVIGPNHQHVNDVIPPEALRRAEELGRLVAERDGAGVGLTGLDLGSLRTWRWAIRARYR